MAHLDLAESRVAGDLNALYWWRRDNKDEAAPTAPLTQRLVNLAERAAPAAAPIEIIDLPGNRLRATAEVRRAVFARKADDEAIDPDLLAAIHHERSNAMFAVATGLIATAAPAAAAIYAATTHENVALGFAMAGTFAASFALYHAVRWLLLMRSDELKIFV